MDEKKTRKTDRRTLYTQMVIKEAMLVLLGKKEYGQITVADLCRSAQINRGTFYLHYDNLSDVINTLFDDALGNAHSMLQQIGFAASEHEKCAYPLCRFLRENPKYQPLFFSDSLRSIAIDRIAENNRADYIACLTEATGQPEQVISALFDFQINGCLAISKRNIKIPDAQWEQIQCGIDRFLKNGIENL